MEDTYHHNGRTTMPTLSTHQGRLSRTGILDRGIPQDTFAIEVEFIQGENGLLHRSGSCAFMSRRKSLTYLVPTQVWENLCDHCWLNEMAEGPVEWRGLMHAIHAARGLETLIHYVVEDDDPHQQVWELTEYLQEHQEERIITGRDAVREELYVWYGLLRELMEDSIREIHATQTDSEHFAGAVGHGRGVNYATLLESPQVQVALTRDVLESLDRAASSYLLRRPHRWLHHHLIVSAPRGILQAVLQGDFPKKNTIVEDVHLNEATFALWDPYGTGDLAQLAHAQAAARALA